MFASRKLRSAILLVALAALATGCENNPLSPPPPRGSSGAVRTTLEWQHPYPLGSDLFRVAGYPDGSFDAVGTAGTVLHFDGTTWSFPETPVRSDLHGLWANSSTDVYACGDGGALVHYDGASWRAINTPTTADLCGVWASSLDTLAVAEADGVVWTRVNRSWTRYDVSPATTFNAMWGYSGKEIYVGGSRAALFRFDGSQWHPIVIFGGQFGDVIDLWGPRPGTIAVLDRWSFAWFDGVQWAGRGPPGHNGNGFWGFSFADQVVVATEYSTHLINGQGVLQNYSMPNDIPFLDVWGRAMDDLYAVGRSGNLAHFDGTAWQALSSGALDNLNDLWMTDTGGIAVGDRGRVLRQNGSTWDEETVGSTYELNGVWDSGDGLTVAVGRYAPDRLNWQQAILMNTGTGWTPVPPVGTAPELFDVWGSSQSDIYAVGWAGEILHYDGTAWTVSVPADGATIAMLRSVSGSSPSSVFAVGRTNDLRGLVYRFDGTSWHMSVHPSVEELDGVWADTPDNVFAVGTAGTILHYDGTGWHRMASHTHDYLFCIWGSGPNDVYAAGWQGAMVHFDGASWTRYLPTTHRTIHGLSGRAASEVFLAGDTGGIWKVGMGTRLGFSHD